MPVWLSDGHSHSLQISLKERKKVEERKMSSNVWELCQIDDEQVMLIQQLAHTYEELENPPAVSLTHDGSSVSDDSDLNKGDSGNLSGIGGLHAALIQTEHTCANFVTDLDKMLSSLQELASAHDSVTGRTNSLMMSCENLMEEQHSLQQTIEYLNEVLAPFDEIESVALLLGIPVDARGKPMMSVPSSSGSGSTDFHNSNIDPRSPEFQGVLIKLSRALHSLQQQSENGAEFKDADKYLRWLKQLQHRATSLVAKSMRELLTQASSACIEASKKTNPSAGVGGGSVSVATSNEDQPLESTPVYQKFRGLGFRMRELSSLLLVSKQFANSKSEQVTTRAADAAGDDDASVMQEVKQTYVIIRNDLLLSFVKEIGLSKLVDKKNGDIVVGAAVSSLCPGIRHAYSVLLRVAQLEQQLFDSLFRVSPSTTVQGLMSPRSGSGSSPRTAENTPNSRFFGASVDDNDVFAQSTSHYSGNSEEVLQIIECLCNIVGDDLRPCIIRESSVDELCRIVTTLSEDVRTQILAFNKNNFNTSLTKKLIQGLDLTISDTQERLTYCAETQLRQQVQLFDPLPSHLSYPDVLETAAKARQDTASGISIAPTSSSQGNVGNADDLSRTWYPPLKNTLSLLSKLFGVIEKSVFEDFARRCVSSCVKSLQQGSDGVKRLRSQLHGDLFLVRHLLILREQLLPFEIRLQGTEKRLDFKPTGQALNRLAANTKSLLRMDASNGFLQLAWDGVPGVAETQVDAKRQLDQTLKTACLNLKQSSLKLIMGPLDAFLAKVAAFCGEIPVQSRIYQTEEDNSVSVTSTVLSPEIIKNLKSQAFIKPDRIKDALDNVQQSIAQTVPDLRDTLKVRRIDITFSSLLADICFRCSCMSRILLPETFFLNQCNKRLNSPN
jgi:hypothetical protein